MKQILVNGGRDAGGGSGVLTVTITREVTKNKRGVVVVCSVNYTHMPVRVTW